jgi:GT2 family glycosyltransferase
MSVDSKRKNPFISIVILNFNGLEYLKRTIHPLTELNYPNYEIIIVDNASSDASVAYIKVNFPAIRLIENEKNVGYSRGKNVGVSQASGECVLLLDNDIAINDKDLLSKLSKNNREKKIGLIQIPLVDEGCNDTRYYGLFFSFYGINSHLPYISIEKILNSKLDLIQIAAPTGGCIFFRKSVWQHIRGFDEIQPFNLDDVDIGPRAWLYGYENYLYTKSYCVHLGTADTIPPDVYVSRFRWIFSGHAIALLKNQSLSNLLVRFPVFCMFQIIKAVRYSFKKKSISILRAFFFSFKFFLFNLSYILRQRANIQSSRVIESDIFLKIPVPKFD